MNAPLVSPRVPRLYYDGPLSPGATVQLPERAARHVQALRLRVGADVSLFNGDGTEWSATLDLISKRHTLANVHSAAAVDRESPLEVQLIQGVCAADRMDLLLQKATELGVAGVWPATTTRSIVRLSPERQERRLTHWRNVVIAACEQCGRNTIPPVAPTANLSELLAQLPTEGERLLLAPDGAVNLRALAAPAKVTLLIGPEGGLAPEEREMVEAAGFTPVRFGPRILRTETAPLAALAAIQALWGDC